MASSTQTPELTPWNTLQVGLGGYFTARVSGLLRISHTLMDRNGQPFARLHEQDAGAMLEAGELKARIERTSRNGYTMLSGGNELAQATTPEGSANILRIECGDRVYEARLRLLRNTAVVRAREGGEISRLSGGLAGRRYEAVFDAEVEGALPVAVLVLHYMTALRRRIYLAT